MSHITTRQAGDESSPLPFERTILTLIDQCCRFDQLAASLKPWACKWSTQTLERWLELPNIPLKQREMLLTSLAIKADERCGVLLDAYDPSGESEEHRLFHRVCIIEWEQRYPLHNAGEAVA